MKFDYRKYSGLLCAAGAFALYLATLSPGAYPGASSKFIADYAGLSPFLPILHPLWWGLVQLVESIPIGSLAIRLNLLSAVCGSLAVWLMYEIVAGIGHDKTYEEHRASFRKGRVQIFSGLVAAGFLATAIPFWMISTRAHPISFDLLFPLFLVLQLQRYRRDGQIRRFYIITILLGMGVVEFPTMLILGAPIFIALLYLMFEKGVFKRRRRRKRGSPFFRWLAASIGLSMLGMLPGLIFALMYRYSPAYEWRDFPNIFRLTIHIVQTYLGELGASTNQLGWMLVSLVSVVPLLVVLIPKRERKRDQVIGSYFFNLVLAVVAVVLLFNMHISPWALYGHRTLVVTPYLLIAVWVGYIAGYWLALASQRHRPDSRTRFNNLLRLAGRRLVLLLCPALIAAAIAVNFAQCDGNSARPVQKLANEIVASMEGRRWLVSNGLLDDMLKIAADEKGLEIEIINPRLGASRPYLRYLSTRFDNPRLKGLAMLGLSPLLQEWFDTHAEEVGRDVAILSNPDLWLASDYNIVPNKLLYFGRKGAVEADMIPGPDECGEIWEKFVFAEKDSSAWPDDAAPWNGLAVRHVGKTANNTGFALQSIGEPRDALEAYKQAYRIDPANVSALLNIALLTDRMEESDAEEWNDRLENHVEEMGRELNSWNLSYMYGYVYEPMAYVNRGLVFAMSGKPNLGVNEIKRAIALGGQGEHLKILLAGMYFVQKQSGKSEELFQEILKENPESIGAIRGLLRINVTRGRFDLARGYLARLEEVGLDPSEVRFEESILESVAGNKDASKRILEGLLKKDSSNLKAWNMLALIATEQNDRELQKKCLEQFGKEGKAVPRELLMAMAQVALTQRETTVARRYIDQLLERQPNNEAFLEWRLRIDVYEFNRQEAEKSVERLMTVNPRNAFANYIMGTLHIYRDQFALAEPFLRVSVEGKRNIGHLNTLAYVLYKNDKTEEAKELVEEALEIDSRHGPAWDTYGMVLYEEQDYDGALRAILRALDFSPDNPEIRLHLAQVYEMKGENQKALEILNELLLNPSQFSLQTYDEVRKTINSVRANLRGEE